MLVGMDSTATEEALEAIAASASGLAAVLRRARTNLPADERDPLSEQAEACLTVLTGTAGLDAMVAAVKVRSAAGYDEAERGAASPASSPQDQQAQDMSMVAELACALTISEPQAGTLLGEARTLTTSLPLTLAALHAGSISWQHARIVVDETTNLDSAAAAALEAHFLDPEDPNPARGCPAGELIPSRFRHKARTWRERHHPVSIEKRHARSLADRRLEYTPERDGMACLTAYLPAHQVAGIWDLTTRAARALQGPDEHRTLTQMRADIAATLLLEGSGNVAVNSTTREKPNQTSTSTAGAEHSLSGLTAGTAATTLLDGTTDLNPADLAGPHDAPGDSGCVADSSDGGPGDSGCVADSSDGGPGDSGGGPDGPTSGVPSPRAQVLITVPVMALLGVTEEPAMLDGYGPIPPSMARRLIADGAESFHRVLIDPRDGAPLEIGRTSYRVTKAQRQWLRLRDGRCPFPGCGNQSLDNEADHVLAWAEGGATGVSNLGQPCPRHHRLRHTTAWSPTQATKTEPPGWASPAGRHYTSEHPDWEPPTWPEHLPPAVDWNPSDCEEPPDDLGGAWMTYRKDGHSEFERP
jgi:hypothetical protein